MPDAKPRGKSSAKPRNKKSVAKRPAAKPKPASTKPGGPAKTARSSSPLSKPKSGHFGRARNRAERLLRDPESAERLADDAEVKSAKDKASKLSAVIDDVRALIRLTRAFARGDYRAISWESMVLVVAALVYLVSPLDLIPDFLPGGLADDAVIVVFVVGMVYEEIDDFLTWEATQSDKGLKPASRPVLDRGSVRPAK